MMQDRIARRAGLLSHVATLLLFAIPVAVAIVLATGGVTPDTLRDAYNIKMMPDDPGTGAILILGAVELTKLCLLLWIIWRVRVWLVACARGAVFTGATARHVQRIGTGLLVLAGLHIIDYTLIVGALTWGNPSGQRSLAIGFGSTEVILILAAGLVTLFGWIQAEAARLSHENQGFV